jgi:hypothetical protein
VLTALTLIAGRPTIAAVQTQVPSNGAPRVARASAWLFLGLSSLYLLVARGRITSGDEWYVYGTAESLAERASWQIEVEGIERTYSRYSIVPSILAVPFCKVAGFVADRIVHDQEASQRASGLTRRDILMAAATFQTPLVTAATAAILFLGLCKLGIRPGPAAATTAVFAVGTLALPYSGSLYVQPIAALAVTCVVFSAALDRHVVLAISLVVLLAIRAELLAIVPVLALHALWFQRPLARSFGWLIAGAATGLTVNVLVNICRDDHWLTGDYGAETFSTPLWIGLWGVLFSSGKGLVWFAPAAATGLLLMPRLCVNAPRVGLLAAGMTTTMFIMVACWWTWHGAWSWGPRLLLPIMPVLMLPIAWLFQDWQRESVSTRWVMILVVIVSVVVQLPGVVRDPSADRSAMRLLIGGNENESIYIPQVGPWGAETNAEIDLFLCRLWQKAPQSRTVLLIAAGALATAVVAMSWCALRRAGVRGSDMGCLVPRTRPGVLLAAAGALVPLSAPTVLQWLLLARAREEAGRSVNLPKQFQAFRMAANEGRWVGHLYVPVQGDYVFFQQGPASQFFLAGRPLFSAQTGPVAVGLANQVQVGFHRLEIDAGEAGRVNTLYWTTPGNAHYKEPIPRQYLASPTVKREDRWAIALAHWKWFVWTVTIATFLFLAIPGRSETARTLGVSAPSA